MTAKPDPVDEDVDNDLLQTRQELKMHMDPRTPDVDSLSTTAYRYFVEAKGGPDDGGSQCYSFRVENVLLEPTMSFRPDGGAPDGGLTRSSTAVSSRPIAFTLMVICPP